MTITSVGGKDFDPAATYTIATNDFMASGGDTYYRFVNATANYDLGIAMDEVVILFSYPNDEVGNPLMERSAYVKNRYSGVYDFEEAAFIDTFGSPVHPFTGVNYLDFYRQVIEAEGAKATFLFSNDCRYIAQFCDQILCCDIHTRNETRDTLAAMPGKTVYTLADVMAAPVDGSGYHDQYGLLGSNKATEEKLKLFPRSCQPVVDAIQARIQKERGIQVEVMVYGDGAFKDPIGGIWELADPVVSPAYTAGLAGKPNELKLKFLADNDFADLSGDELKAAIESDADLARRILGCVRPQADVPLQGMNP